MLSLTSEIPSTPFQKLSEKLQEPPRHLQETDQSLQYDSMKRSSALRISSINHHEPAKTNPIRRASGPTAYYSVATILLLSKTESVRLIRRTVSETLKSCNNVTHKQHRKITDVLDEGAARTCPGRLSEHYGGADVLDAIRVFMANNSIDMQILCIHLHI